MFDPILICGILFFFVAVLYSSVGFGGGSSYIAILLLLGLATQDVRCIALICNVLVVFGSTVNYSKKGLIDWKQILPLVGLSVPFAFLGGRIQLESNVYLILASLTLIFASLLLMFKNKVSHKFVGRQSFSTSKLAIIGALIGFISGLIGIGGGIFLAPLLFLLDWNSPKMISATSSVFILVNSLAGLLGMYSTFHSAIPVTLILTLGLIVLIGGQIGNRINLHRLSPRNIQWITACLVGFVGVRILFLQFYG